MNYILFDDELRDNLLPLTYTRPVAELRCGILSLREKWEKRLNTKCSHITQNYLKEKFPLNIDDDNLLINGALLPNREILNTLASLSENEVLTFENRVLALRVPQNRLDEFYFNHLDKFKKIEYKDKVDFINYPWDIFRLNEQEIEKDFNFITQNKQSEALSPTNRYIKAERIFVEKGAKIEFSILNPADGYIYVGKEAEIMENATVHGSLALCEHSVLKIGAKIYGATTIGPHSKVGGEINNSVLTGFSNKAHDGFLGNAVLGEWCNLGADTNNSNLKNNYADVKMWNYPAEKFIPTNLQFAGLIMGDHSKSGINMMFNTGTVIGVSANIFGTGFPRNFIPSFSWGGAAGFSVYKPQKAYEVAALVMSRRKLEFDTTEKKILDKVFELTAKYRR